MRLLRTSTNIGAIAVGQLVSTGVVLITIPYLIRNLGIDAYGVWALVIITSGYISLIDFGLTIATGRLIATERAKGNAGSIGAIVSTAFVMYGAIALVCIVLSIVCSWFMVFIFNIPAEHVRDAMVALVVCGAGISIYFLFSLFTSALWAYERFDVINAIEVASQLSRAAAIFAFISSQSSLTDVALITSGGHLITGVLSLIACWRIIPSFRIRIREFSLALARQMLSLGSSFFFVNAARGIIFLVGSTVVGNRMDTSDVTSFSVARQLITYSNGFLGAVTQFAAARSVVLHAANQTDRQRQLFWYGAIFAAAVSFYIVGGFLILGSPFMRLWQGGRLDHVYLLLVILAVGEAFPMSQWVTNGVILATGRQQTLVKLHLSEAACALVSSVIAERYFGLPGVCVALAVNATIFRGILQWYVGLKILDASATRYVLSVFAPALAICVVLVPAFWVLGQTENIVGWGPFILASVIYSLAFWAFFLLLLKLRVVRLPD